MAVQTTEQKSISRTCISLRSLTFAHVDGANCPFNPTCSSFLVQSISETNPIQGLLMSFDRFTRDTNIYGRQEHYPRFGNTHFYDPITLYTLDEKKINFIPATTYINEE